MNNWLLIVVGVIFLVCMVVGGIRGFFKIGLSLLASVLTILLVIYLSPYVADALVEYTPVDEMIEEKCVEMFMPELSPELFEGKDLTGTPLEGIQPEQFQNMSDLELSKMGITASDVVKALGEIPKDQQIRELENSSLPKFLKDALLENNNAMIYEELGVDSFAAYVGTYISRMVLKILSFLVTFILAVIIVRALMAAVDIIGELPGIGFLNHLGGVALGGLIALMIVWLAFLVLALLYSTEVGKTCFELIDQSKILTFLYEKNLLLTKLLSFK